MTVQDLRGIEGFSGTSVAGARGVALSEQHAVISQQRAELDAGRRLTQKGAEATM